MSSVRVEPYVINYVLCLSYCITQYCWPVCNCQYNSMIQVLYRYSAGRSAAAVTSDLRFIHSDLTITNTISFVCTLFFLLNTFST